MLAKSRPDQLGKTPLQAVKKTTAALSAFGNNLIAAARADDPRRATIPLDRPAFFERTAQRREFIRANQQAAAVRELYLPENETTLHLIMRANFRGFDIIGATLKLAEPETIKTLYLATLSFNRQVTRELAAMLDAGQVENVVLLCSVFYRAQQPEDYEQLRNILTERGHKMGAALTHAKVVAVELSGGRCFVGETSGNLRSCSSLEQLAFTQSRPLYEFHREWIDAVYQRTVGK